MEAVMTGIVVVIQCREVRIILFTIIYRLQNNKNISRVASQDGTHYPVCPVSEITVTIIN